ncbi:unnamed protein product [Phytophthora fragariaefolia]|uniref:Unnamed protein product n=1 Tax=Phytophthora fragariaefolia TaxID=1490495 RepID=A0A9W6XBA2_9STRA|nr:unnamed protein product [Phytophthora fragariaefolia]
MSKTWTLNDRCWQSSRGGGANELCDLYFALDNELKKQQGRRNGEQVAGGSVVPAATLELQLREGMSARDEDRAERYVDTVRPAMAALWYVHVTYEESNTMTVASAEEVAPVTMKAGPAAPTAEGEALASPTEEAASPATTSGAAAAMQTTALVLPVVGGVMEASTMSAGDATEEGKTNASAAALVGAVTGEGEAAGPDAAAKDADAETRSQGHGGSPPTAGSGGRGFGGGRGTGRVSEDMRLAEVAYSSMDATAQIESDDSFEVLVLPRSASDVDVKRARSVRNQGKDAEAESSTGRGLRDAAGVVDCSRRIDGPDEVRIDHCTMKNESTQSAGLMFECITSFKGWGIERSHGSQEVMYLPDRKCSLSGNLSNSCGSISLPGRDAVHTDYSQAAAARGSYLK